MEDKIAMEPGVYHDIDFLDYVKIDALNHSELKKFKDNSPRHYKYNKDNEIEKESQALDDGRIYHLALLEKDKFDKLVVHKPSDWKKYKLMLPDTEVEQLEKDKNRMFDGRTKANKIIMSAFDAEYEAMLEEEPNLQLVDYPTYWKALQIRKAVLKHPKASKMITESKKEVTLVWIDKETGIKCKGRLDIDNEGSSYIGDFKKTRNAHPFGFAKDVKKHNYYSQFAFYGDGAITLGHKSPKAFIIIAVEDYEPFYCQVFYTKWDSLWIEKGREWYRSAIEEYNYCMTTGEWHGYYDKFNDNFEMYELPILNSIAY